MSHCPTLTVRCATCRRTCQYPYDQVDLVPEPGGDGRIWRWLCEACRRRETTKR